MNPASAKKRPPLHPLERLLLFVASVHLCILPWIFGLSHYAAQMTSAALGTLALLIALIPRHYTARYTDAQEFRIVPWRRLVRFPWFWCGLGLLLLLTVQAGNASWFYESNGYRWWVTPRPSVDWLPTSVDVPADRHNIWRNFAVYASVWALSCALWIGVTRRRSLQILCWVMVANALVLGVVGAMHSLSGPEMSSRVLWKHMARDGVFGSFVYRNHAGGYLGLIGSVAVALAAWSHFDGLRRMARSTPTGMWLLFAALIGLAVTYTLSRAAFAIYALFVLTAVVAQVWLSMRHRERGATSWIPTASLLGLLAMTVAFVATQLDFSKLEERFAMFQKHGREEVSFKSREQARERAYAMWQDHWLRGIGSAGFGYHFPRYIHDHPYLYGGGRFIWEHAHIDLLEIPIELGLVGTLLIALALLWWLWRWFRTDGLIHPVGLMLLLGTAQTFLHAAVDFPYQHPGIIVTWWALLIIALRWLELDPVHAPPVRFGGGGRLR